MRAKGDVKTDFFHCFHHFAFMKMSWVVKVAWIWWVESKKRSSIANWRLAVQKKYSFCFPHTEKETDCRERKRESLIIPIECIQIPGCALTIPVVVSYQIPLFCLCSEREEWDRATRAARGILRLCYYPPQSVSCNLQWDYWCAKYYERFCTLAQLF